MSYFSVCLASLFPRPLQVPVAGRIAGFNRCTPVQLYIYMMIILYIYI